MPSKDILSEAARQTGMTVPEGYFADFSNRMAASLPVQEWEKGPKIMPKSFWQKARPYVYMAAMFAGIWCMMKMFDMMRPSADMTIDSNPAMTAAINNETFFDDFVLPAVDESALLDELYNEGFDTAEFNDELN